VTKSCSLLAAAGAHAKQGARFPIGLARRSWRPLVFVPTVDSAPADLLPLGFLAEFSVPARSQHQLTRLDFPFVRAGGVSHVSQRCCFLFLDGAVHCFISHLLIFDPKLSVFVWIVV
jgi:hypothetical protein